MGAEELGLGWTLSIWKGSRCLCPDNRYGAWCQFSCHAGRPVMGRFHDPNYNAIRYYFRFPLRVGLGCLLVGCIGWLQWKGVSRETNIGELFSFRQHGVEHVDRMPVTRRCEYANPNALLLSTAPIPCIAATAPARGAGRASSATRRRRTGRSRRRPSRSTTDSTLSASEEPSGTSSIKCAPALSTGSLLPCPFLLFLLAQ